jgi:hypothetical protein
LADRIKLLGCQDRDLGAPFAVQVLNLVVADRDVEARAVAEMDVTDQGEERLEDKPSCRGKTLSSIGSKIWPAAR